MEEDKDNKKANDKREYKRVSDEERANLINMVENSDLSISKAASMLGLNYTNAMSIMRIYRRENRTQSIRPNFGKSFNYISPVRSMQPAADQEQDQASPKLEVIGVDLLKKKDINLVQFE